MPMKKKKGKRRWLVRWQVDKEAEVVADSYEAAVDAAFALPGSEVAEGAATGIEASEV